MRAVWTTRAGGPEVLEVRDAPDPLPRAGEVRVRVHAAGLNFADIMGRLGLYPDAPKLPAVFGYEVAGVVDALGQGVTAPGSGTRVLAMTRFGGQAELVCVPSQQVVPMPEGMSFEVGAALPLNYLTAYHALLRVGALRQRERVLVHMAAGGVGLAAVQLARTVEGVEILGTASASKHSFLREQGCTHPIDYRTQDYEAEVRRLTGGRGVDVVLDPLGGKDWKKGYRLLRPGGRLVAYGFANLATGEKRDYLRLAQQAVQIPVYTPLGLMNDNRAIAGVNLGHLWGEFEVLREEMEALVGLYGRGAVRPHVDAAFPFGRAADAHRHIQARRNVGKVVLVP